MGSRGRAFASIVFERDSRHVANLMHGFAVFVYFTCANVYGLAAYPAKAKSNDHFGAPALQRPSVAQEPRR